MANPQKPQKRKRTNQQHFFLSNEELKQITARMTEIGMTNRSIYYREMALHGYIIYYDFDGLRQLLYEINKIGQNINQIAKHTNLYGDIPKYALEEINANLDKVVKHYCNNIPGTAGCTKRKNTKTNDS